MGWRTVAGKELFWAVLVGVVVTCVFRIAMWGVGVQGVGTSSITFVMMDKFASLFFALTILIFVYMWARAIAVLVDAPPKTDLVLMIASGVVALVITVVTILYAVQISRTAVTAYYGVFVADKAELVLSAFTMALIMALFVLIIVVGIKIGGLRDDLSERMTSKADEKLRNLRLILVAVGLMVVFLIVRFALVCLRNFTQTTSYGYLVFYGVATIVPEVLSCIVMIGIVVFTFYQSKQVDFVASSLKTNSTYLSGGASSSSTVEMSRYEV